MWNCLIGFNYLKFDYPYKKWYLEKVIMIITYILTYHSHNIGTPYATSYMYLWSIMWFPWESSYHDYDIVTPLVKMYKVMCFVQYIMFLYFMLLGTWHYDSLCYFCKTSCVYLWCDFHGSHLIMIMILWLPLSQCIESCVLFSILCFYALCHYKHDIMTPYTTFVRLHVCI